MNEVDIRLVKKLLMLIESDLDDIDLKKFSQELMQLFREIGSETPDNLNCCAYIDYGIVSGRQFGLGSIIGLKIKDKNVLLSDVLNAVEDLELPSEVREYFPTLNLDEWRAVARMVTMILIFLEKVIDSH